MVDAGVQSKLKLMVIQPGAFGDIIICAPIAKHYADLGYDVFWPAREEFHDLLDRFDYVTPILLDEEMLHEDWMRSDTIKAVKIYEDLNFDYGLNLADRGAGPAMQTENEKFEETKYRLSNIPFSAKHDLVWTRDRKKEDELYSDLVGDGGDYVLCALQASDNKIDLPTPNVVSESGYRLIEMDRRAGFVIFDWYRVIQDAKAIYSLESSFHCFVDGIVNELDVPLYRMQRTPDYWWTVSNHWVDIE
jgi:hypothetical protein